MTYNLFSVQLYSERLNFVGLSCEINFYWISPGDWCLWSFWHKCDLQYVIKSIKWPIYWKLLNKVRDSEFATHSSFSCFGSGVAIVTNT